MIDWMVRNFISKKADVVLKICKTQIRLRVEYCIQVLALASRHGNWSEILRFEGIQRRVTKIRRRVTKIRRRVTKIRRRVTKIRRRVTKIRRRVTKIRRRVTKIIKRRKDYNYKERLEKLGLTTLLERRMRGDQV